MVDGPSICVSTNNHNTPLTLCRKLLCFGPFQDFYGAFEFQDLSPNLEVWNAQAGVHDPKTHVTLTLPPGSSVNDQNHGSVYSAMFLLIYYQ